MARSFRWPTLHLQAFWPLSAIVQRIVIGIAKIPGSRKRDGSAVFYVAPQQEAPHIPPFAQSRSSGAFGPAPSYLGVVMLKGKSALVTGSTSGIGLAIARALAAAGRQRHHQRLRRQGRDRKGARRHREGFRRQSALFGRRYEQTGRDRRHGAHRRKEFWLARRAGQQCRHPVRRRRSRNSRSRNGIRSSRSICRRHSTPSAPPCPG